MKTEIIEGFVTVQKWPLSAEPYSFNWFKSGMEPYMSEDCIIIATYNIEIEVPDNLDELIHAGTLTALQNKRKLILADNEQRINEIDRQISEFLSIENKS